MKLQLEYINIKKVAFSSAEEDKTRIDNKVLYINKSELIKKFADLNLKDVDIEIAVPGESCRITHVGDVVQPRVKADDPDATFPGVLGKMAKAGDGITKVLNGVTVMECFQQDVPQHCFVDMSGIGAEYTEYSKTYNIVVSAFPAEGTDKFKYTDSLKTLVLSISRYLAELAIDLDADETETFELKNKPCDCNLPRVAYVSTIFSHKRNCEPLLYGNNCYGLLPTIVHPNELLDGAMINRNYEQMSNGETTYSIQNHAIIRELYARDGVDIDFVGVILENSSSNSVDKKRSALMTATLAKYFLNADLAILSKEGGGHPQLDMALCCDEMAKYGIKSAFIIVELMATDNSGDMESILFNTPNADVIISGGKYETLEFPKMDKIIGGEHVSCFKGDLTGPFKLPNRYIRGSLSQIGGSKVMSISY